MKRTISLLLFAAMLASMAAGCGQSEQGDTTPDETSGSSTSDTTADVEVERSKTPDSLPDDLNFDGVTINVLFPESDGKTADQIDWEAEDNGEVVVSAVYSRQTKVEERLNVDFNIIDTDAVGAWNDKLKADVMAGGGSYDLVYGAQHRTTRLITEGLYLDLSDQKYIDFDQPWWNNNFMDEIAIGDTRYLLAGDISLSMLSYTSCMYFNKEQFATISGETDEDLYKLVLDGGWTMDKLSEYCKKSYRDINGNSEFDDSDQYGMGAVTASTVDHITFDAGVRYTSRDKSGIPELTLNNERTITYVEKLYDLFYNNEGVRVYPATQDTLRILLPNKLMNSEVTFMGGYFYSADLLREMTIDYGIIPYPKMDDTVESYSALVHDSAMLVSVPVTCDKIDAVCAAIEATAAENYRTVTPAYYEVALKTKYVRDDMSGQIIDLIHDNTSTDFAYTYNYAINSIGTIFRTLMADKTSDFASTYAKIETTTLDKLAELIEAFEGME